MTSLEAADEGPALNFMYAAANVGTSAKSVVLHVERERAGRSGGNA
jgi:hypothetical protein